MAAIFTREEHKDHLALHIGTDSEVNPHSLTTELAKSTREAITFNLEVQIVSEQDLLPESPPIHDD